SGDARLPLFHVRPGGHSEFAEQFERRYGSPLRLMNSLEAIALGLFGPCPLSAAARLHFRDFVGIALPPLTLHYVVPAPPDARPHRVYLAQHAGLTSDEMEIPLLVA